MVCTVVAVVFLLVLNSYCVVITNKILRKKCVLTVPSTQNCQANEPDVNHPWPNIVITWDKLTHSVQWNKDFDWFTQAAVTAWLCSCSLVYISRSCTHGFSSAIRLSNVATSRQLCTFEQIKNHHSTRLSKQRYQKPLIQSIPFHEIWYLYVLYRVSTSYP